MARSLSVAVISDVHLGTYGCHATELLNYLKSIDPQILILNGDIIDGWQFSKRYFPQSHFEVINEIFKKVSEGTRVVYITGNHDETLRRYSDMEIGNILLTDKFLLNIDGKKMWIFHGDVFDNTTKGSAKIIARLGGKGYDLLILLNRAINFCLKLLKRGKVSFSKRVKNGVKKAITYINNFEQTISDLAIEKKYDYVICGHIHQPIIKTIENEEGSVVYLNSGDWIENLTALEYNHNQWNLYQYTEHEFADQPKSKKLYKKHEVNLELDILQYIHSTKAAI
ncbi:UDP-2,3-diacylglucosamine hydrolase [Taibaiella sp. KBW10]|uniref:UDP-2,3-diacylglucosamine diphosphatase n=1 Tax=Taibaiella sp. KBW10 TaxID=2153357 RepID=UPI000F5A529D|nr:UDP-2,3-diacylglucosamine diphosphatase [Taibaiella sp. KBW10]RQO30112.1 UDP-2,3-diacylglucosamine hydrolase [Taibaiella sp. KBW10]